MWLLYADAAFESQSHACLRALWVDCDFNQFDKPNLKLCNYSGENAEYPIFIILRPLRQSDSSQDRFHPNIPGGRRKGCDSPEQTSECERRSFATVKGSFSANLPDGSENGNLRN